MKKKVKQTKTPNHLVLVLKRVSPRTNVRCIMRSHELQEKQVTRACIIILYAYCEH